MRNALEVFYNYLLPIGKAFDEKKPGFIIHGFVESDTLYVSPALINGFSKGDLRHALTDFIEQMDAQINVQINKED